MSAGSDQKATYQSEKERITGPVVAREGSDIYLYLDELRLVSCVATCGYRGAGRLLQFSTACKGSVRALIRRNIGGQWYVDRHDIQSTYRDDRRIFDIERQAPHRAM